MTSSFENINLHLLWRVIKRFYIYIICAMIAGSGITYACCKYLVKPTYMASFKIYAWSGTSQFDINDVTKHSILISNASRELMFSREIVNDYQELLKSHKVSSRVEEMLDTLYPKLAKIPYSLEVSGKEKSRFIDCRFFSTSPEKALAAAQITSEVFGQSVEEVMKLKKPSNLDDPRFHPYPVAPRTKRLCIFAALVCGFATFSGFLVWILFNNVLRNGEQVKAELGLTTLGALPDVSEAFGEEENERLISGLISKDSYHFNIIYEQFQLFLTNLRFSIPSNHNGPVSILVTSAVAGEGKSFISSNLAQMLAKKNKRVLLIGCDLRKPAIHHYFGLNRKMGLVNMVLGENTFDEVVHRNVTDLPLDVMLSGPIPPEPLAILEMFCESDFRETHCKDYDYVIYDCPPLNMADALLFAKTADRVLLVARANETPVYLVRHANNQLHALGLKIGGVILNRTGGTGNSGYGYGYGYGGYGYKYGYGYRYAYKYSYSEKDGKGGQHRSRRGSLLKRLFGSSKKKS